MLYNSNPELDVLSILEYINTYTETIGLEVVGIDTVKLGKVCLRMRVDFPCSFGIEKASIFKKAAVFVSCFVEENPIDLKAFKDSNLNEHVINKNPNAIIALDLAFKFLSLAKVTRSDGLTLIIQNGIKLSLHSYYDFLDMLSQDIELKTHFMPLALLFEQVVYKTHSNMQYEPIDFALETQEDEGQIKYQNYFDQTDVPQDWENEFEFWNDLTPKA